MSLAVEYMPGEFLWNEHQAYITRTAQSISRSYWTVEEEDVRQEIWVFLWEKEADLVDNGVSDAYIKTCIKNVARNYALKMRDSTLLQTDKFYYSFEEVKELLPVMFSTYDSWVTAPVPDGCSTESRNDNVEILCDFSIAYNTLSEAQREILYRRYGADEELVDAKDRQQASRALKKLVLVLNSETDKRAKDYTGPGSRKAMSNAKAQFEAVKHLDD